MKRNVILSLLLAGVMLFSCSCISANAESYDDIPSEANDFIETKSSLEAGVSDMNSAPALETSSTAEIAPSEIVAIEEDVALYAQILLSGEDVKYLEDEAIMQALVPHAPWLKQMIALCDERATLLDAIEALGEPSYSPTVTNSRYLVWELTQGIEIWVMIGSSFDMDDYTTTYFLLSAHMIISPNGVFPEEYKAVWGTSENLLYVHYLKAVLDAEK